MPTTSLSEQRVMTAYAGSLAQFEIAVMADSDTTAAAQAAQGCFPASHKPITAGDRAPSAERGRAPPIIATAFGSPYTATKEPKRGPFSWPSSTWYSMLNQSSETPGRPSLPFLMGS